MFEILFYKFEEFWWILRDVMCKPTDINIVDTIQREGRMVTIDDILILTECYKQDLMKAKEGSFVTIKINAKNIKAKFIFE